ncbi:hypothetical protein SeMB42_g03573 [Synchytrium endobioticum]|uniref:Uncharacterized protein n=1 Tax=Synchytrium endobioticum TaxID=286115 RepID=A0A507CVY1_9FUNG|nr:hypothetical protein SeLEV6574_g05131 [Synchytrium endobioticum]TPX46744.1 hypothetical protein SeMB42_g03573 [Synchytrium endobioticum]
MSNYPLRNRNGTMAIGPADDKENNATSNLANLVSNLKDGAAAGVKEVAKLKGKPAAKVKQAVAEEPTAGSKRESRKPLGAKDNVPNLHSTKDNANSKITKPKESKPLTKRVSKNVPTTIEEEITVTTQAPEGQEPIRKSRFAKNPDAAKVDAVKAAMIEAHSAKITTTTKSVEFVVVAPSTVAVSSNATEEESTAKSTRLETPPPHVPDDTNAEPESQHEWDNLDADDAHDPVMVSEYVVEIFEYMRRLEIRTLAEPNYMDHQHEITWQMRSILVDWIVDVHSKFRLLPETLYLTVNLIDRFLSARVVSLSKLQLVGIAALFIAAKYEEIVAPSIENLLYMAENGYSPDEVVRAERYVLGALEFSIQYQSPMSFLRRGSKADNYDIQTRTLAKYLMEISIIDHRFLVCPPSEVAAAGLYLARRMLERGEWDANLIHYSGYTDAQLAPCANLMLDFLSHPTAHDAVYRKYSGKKFMRASAYVRDWMEKNPGAQVVAGSLAAQTPGHNSDVTTP